MARKLLAAAALVLLCAASVQASRWHLEADEQGRQLLQAAKSPNCTRIDAHCSQCRNQRIPGTRRSELVCYSCESGYRLRRDGISKTCGELKAYVKVTCCVYQQHQPPSVCLPPLLSYRLCASSKAPLQWRFSSAVPYCKCMMHLT
jgi:hypothetical protein